MAACRYARMPSCTLYSLLPSRYAFAVVTVHIPTGLRSLSGDRETVEVEGGASLRQVIERLEKECPGIKERLMYEGDIHPGIAFFIDGDQTSEGLIQRVPEDAHLYILPAIGGGR